MDFITSTAILPLLLGCVGLFSLFKLLQWLRMRAYVRNAVVVITGATSGLGRGGLWGSAVGEGLGAWVQTHDIGRQLGSEGQEEKAVGAPGLEVAAREKATCVSGAASVLVSVETGICMWWHPAS